MTADAKTLKTWQADLAALRAAIDEPGAADMRAKLNVHLRSFINSIAVYPVGFATAYDASKHGTLTPGPATKTASGKTRRRGPKRDPQLDEVDTIVEQVEEYDLRPAKRAVAFAQHVLARRMSREGRVYRVRFRTGERVDLVPPGSLATGYTLLKEGNGKSLTVAGPDLDALWQAFGAGT
ncbi:hypothetical protein [Roseimaritima sediminicola]|uniref:hypothetical protein n=1 Tax=Roseimaritima sediminicola TaxID=2662066 RepID=UPI00129825C1|nr:hypothetical protein [Roseimaritima sediminicola]